MNALEITIGFSISLSGKFQLQGRQALQGLLLWQSYINAQGGIAIRAGEKRAVRLIWYDDRSRINYARENVVRLLQTDQVDILVGPYSSSLTTSAAEIAEEHKRILWNYGGSSDEIFSHGRRYLVGIASPASDYLRELPRRLAEEFSGLNRICVLYSGRGTDFARDHPGLHQCRWESLCGELQPAQCVFRHDSRQLQAQSAQAVLAQFKLRGSLFE